MRTFKILCMLIFFALGACSPDDNSESRIDSLQSKINIFNSEGTLIRSYNVEVADTMEEMYHGLMGRTALDEDSGYLFDVNIVPRDMEIAMWMKDTLIPLDIIFADKKGTIFFIYENAKPNDLTSIRPPRRPRVIVEVNGGQSKKYGIKVGDTIKTNVFEDL